MSTAVTAVTAAYSFSCPIVQRKHLQGAAPQRLLKGRPGPFLCEAIREVRRRATWVDHGWPGSTWGFWGSKNGEFNPRKWIKYDKMVISNMSWTMSWPKNVEVAWCHNQDLIYLTDKYEVLWSDWRQNSRGIPETWILPAKSNRVGTWKWKWQTGPQKVPLMWWLTTGVWYIWTNPNG